MAYSFVIRANLHERQVFLGEADLRVHVSPQVAAQLLQGQLVALLELAELSILDLDCFVGEVDVVAGGV